MATRVIRRRWPSISDARWGRSGGFLCPRPAGQCRSKQYPAPKRGPRKTRRKRPVVVGPGNGGDCASDRCRAAGAPQASIPTTARLTPSSVVGSKSAARATALLLRHDDAGGRRGAGGIAATRHRPPPRRSHRRKSPHGRDTFYRPLPRSGLRQAAAGRRGVRGC